MALRLTELFDDAESVSSDESEELNETLGTKDDTQKLFKHFPKFFDSDYFTPLMKAIKEKIEGRKINGYSTMKRKSCIFRLQPGDGGTWLDGHSYPYSKVPSIIKKIQATLQRFNGETYDYVLAHIYYDGKGSIAYHNDSEAMNSNIASVSFGTTRKFRLRKMGRTTGWDYEFRLGSGDLFMMYEGCQSVYMHTVWGG